MRELISRTALRFIKICNVVLMTMPFAACWFGYYAERISSPFYAMGNWAVVAAFALTYMVLARVYDGFKISYSRISELIYSQFLGVSVADGFMYMMIILLTRGYANIVPGAICLGTQVVTSCAWSFLVSKFYFAVFKARRTAAIYDWDADIQDLIKKYGMERKFALKKLIHVSECIDEPTVLDGFDAVFLGDLETPDRNEVLKICVNKGISAYVLPEPEDLMMSGAERLHMFHLPVMRVSCYDPHPEYLAAKRIFDFTVSGIAVLVFMPVILVTAAAIKICDRGPVFYKQRRLTKNGKEFDVLKFRSMRVDAEANGVAQLSSGENDPRITPVGRVIRKCRIDEIPQLFNIMGGSMSIVGPRPERPEIAAQFEEKLPDFHLRLQAKAGLTGYAQVYGKYNTSPANKLKMDLMYISNPSFIEDLKICFATVKILFMNDSTEGFTEEQAAAYTGGANAANLRPIRIMPANDMARDASANNDSRKRAFKTKTV